MADGRRWVTGQNHTHPLVDDQGVGAEGVWRATMPCQATASTGPFLLVATFCQDVQLAADRRTATLVGVGVDTLVVPAAASPAGEPDPDVALELPFAVVLNAGSFVGRTRLRVTLHGVEAVLTGGDAEVVIREPFSLWSSLLVLGLAHLRPGLCWFDVRLGSRSLTRMPLRVVFERRPAPVPHMNAH